MSKIEITRDAPCKTYILQSLDGKPLAFSSDVHGSDDKEDIEKAALYKICLPDSTLCILEELINENNSFK